VTREITTLKIAVEPFGLRAADVARPPPRVSVARRAPQHRGLLPPPSPPYPVLPLFLSTIVSMRPDLPLRSTASPLLALRLATGWGVRTGIPGARRGEAVAVEKTMAR
jgi:hypothetical protein